MAGAIIENMSTKKLCLMGGILLVCQVLAFLVGGLIGEFSALKLFSLCLQPQDSLPAPQSSPPGVPCPEPGIFSLFPGNITNKWGAAVSICSVGKGLRHT